MMNRLHAIAAFALDCVSGEWLLTKCHLPNGGTVIALRATIAAALIYVGGLGLTNLIDPARGWEFSSTELRLQVLATGKWFGAIFVGVYTALYSRFASQWAYVAGIYNQIKAAECRGVDPALKTLNLRWFDPTQAYCHNRIDKGLAEALMLKRAKCTVYLVQESDTLGKDSELASTLAQGKAVIAFVPNGDEKFVDDLIAKTNVDSSAMASTMLQLLRTFDPALAWANADVRRWLDDPAAMEEEKAQLRGLLIRTVKRHYDKRAKTIKDDHPLGIQVNLTTGVANGVLVVRTERDCARLVRQILTSKLDFDVEDKVINGLTYVFLRERISGCIFRVMTGDLQLSNAFWNFYLTQPN